MNDEKRFDEKAMARILAKSAELEKHDDRRMNDAPGYSLQEIESIAREAGISPESVREAAAELAAHDSRLSPRFLGAATKVEENVSLPAPAGEDSMEEALASLPEIVDMQGSGTLRKGALHWSSDSFSAYRRGYDIVIDIAAREQGTGISVKAHLGNAAGGIFGGVMGGLGVGAGLGVGFGVGLATLHSPLLTAVFFVGTMAISYALSRAIYVRLVRRVSKQLKGILARLTEILGPAQREPPAIEEDHG